jgi:SAM-dependent methyltransferase
MWWYIILLVTACFTLVVFFGAPYLPTLSKQVEVALDLLDLQPGETMLELGCGDGRVMLAAARRGWLVVGYELNPIMVAVTWLRTRRYRRQVTIIWGNFFRKTLLPADGIFCFILPRFMPVIHQKILTAREHDRQRNKSDNKPLKLASFAFAITSVKPAKYNEGVFLYKYE